MSASSSGSRTRKTAARASAREDTDELVRLRRQLAEALEQQTATADILKVISSSPTDIQPVFEAILESATRLCDAHMADLALYDGDTYLPVAQGRGNARWVIARWSWIKPWRPDAGSGTARVIAERQPIHVTDLS